MCIFKNNEIKEIVFSIRGTDFTFLEENDIYLDGLLLYGKEMENERYAKYYSTLRDVINNYKNYKIVLCGHSLGGRYCIDLLDSKLGNSVNEVHVFNCATSMSHLYKSIDCFNKNQDELPIYCKNREKLYIHIVNKDPISALSIGEKSKKRIRGNFRKLLN